MIITDLKLNGRYVIERELEAGGLGRVYLARDTRLNSRLVVIKTLPESKAGTLDDAWLRRKFDEGIVALERIKHPGVVHIYDAGWMPDGKPFFVMPYIEGESLRGVIGGRAMELKRAARIICQLGSALSAAHDTGVIHRDLKPENVMLQTSGADEFAILIDFGIATIMDFPSAPGEQQTAVAGTLHYMAPEQLRGWPGPASDVWALGVVAYEMATGRVPFPAGSELELDDMQKAGRITGPKSLRPELPEAAQEVILKALSYDPASRHAQARGMGEAFLRAVTAAEAPTLASDYPATMRQQTTPPAAESRRELLRRCRELFESLNEFNRPDTLRAFLRLEGLESSMPCVRSAADIDFDHLLDCLYRSGHDYRGQALLNLLAALASRYKGDWREQECDGLRGRLRHLLAPAPGR